jgi:hypothetical protein
MALIDDHNCMKFNYEERSDVGTVTDDTREIFDNIIGSIDLRSVKHIPVSTILAVFLRSLQKVLVTYPKIELIEVIEALLSLNDTNNHFLLTQK